MFITSNLATSLNGKIGTEKRQFFPLGSPLDLRTMIQLRADADCVLIGASTLRTFRKPIVFPKDKKNHTARGSQLLGRPVRMAALLSSSLEGVSPNWEYFQDPSYHRLLLVGASPTSPRKRKLFEKTSEIMVLKKETPKNPIAHQILEALSTRGIERLLIEGGGEVMWHFARHNLIDIYHLTLTPRILGGKRAPTLVDGDGFLPKSSLQLKLRSCQVRGNEIFLQYQKTVERSPKPVRGIGRAARAGS